MHPLDIRNLAAAMLVGQFPALNVFKYIQRETLEWAAKQIEKQPGNKGAAFELRQLKGEL